MLATAPPTRQAAPYLYRQSLTGWVIRLVAVARGGTCECVEVVYLGWATDGSETGHWKEIVVVKMEG